jgi:hypothetical protein
MNTKWVEVIVILIKRMEEWQEIRWDMRVTDITDTDFLFRYRELVWHQSNSCELV